MADFKRLFADRTWRVIALGALGFSTLALFMTVGSDTTKCAFAAAGTCPAGDTRTFARGLQINTDAADSDTIISGDGETNLLFVDASTDRIGIGTSTPATLLHVAGAARVDGAFTIGALSLSGTLSANNNNILGVNSLTATSSTMGTLAVTSIGAHSLTGAITAGNQSITGVNSLTATSSTFGTIAATSIGGYTLTGALLAGNQSITGVNNLTATSSTIGTLAVTSIGAHSLTGAITAGNQSITGINSLTATSSTIGTLTLTNPLTVANGGCGTTSLTAYAVLTGGTTATNPCQSVSGVGTSGQVLTSNGAGALPTWQTAAAGGGSGTFPDDGWFTATSTWTYSSADAPVFVIATSIDEPRAATGTRLKLTQTTGGTKYGIVVNRTASALTVYMGTDYTLANEAITSPEVSPVRFPAGFPAAPTKWRVQLTDTTSRTQASPTGAAFYNLGSLSITVPIGSWLFSYQIDAKWDGGTNPNRGTVALSTSSSSVSDNELAYLVGFDVGATGQVLRFPVNRQKLLDLTAKATYYAIMNATHYINEIAFDNAYGTMIVTALSAYY